MKTLLQDLRYALRQLHRNPGFTLIAVLTLALGIAVNATMFSMVSAFLLRRPSGRDPERVIVVSTVDPSRSFNPDTVPISPPNYLAWRDANHVFTELAAGDQYRTISLTAQKQSEAVHSAAVTANYFSVIGAVPQLGRVFQAGEDHPGQDHVVILSHDVWVRRFASDPSIIDRTIRLNREDYTVIGVMPADFRLLGWTPQIWTPLVLNLSDQTAAARKARYLYVVGRLNPGISLAQARAEMVTLARRSQETFPDTEKGVGITVRTLPDFLVHDFGIRSALAVIMTTVAFILLIACANVSGLLLARAAARRKEIAIRSALGAGRLRILRQLLTEGLLIAFLGGGLGVLLSYWGIELIRANMAFNESVSAVPLGLDWNVLLFAAAISLLCAVLCALAPSLNASRTDITTNLKSEGRAASPGRWHSRLRGMMVTAEIALALLLLVGSALLFTGIARIERQSLGFQAEHILTAGMILDNARYKDASQQINFVQDLISRLQHLPGTESVAVTSDLPATGPGSATFHIKGQPEAPNSEPPSALNFVVTPDYLQTAGISLLRGRAFVDADNAKTPRVLMVNQKFVDRFFPQEDPIGKQIRLDGHGDPNQWSQIVAVVGNVKSYSESPRDEPEIYEPLLQRPLASFSVMMRGASDPTNLTSGLRNAVAQIDAELPLSRVISMPAVIQAQRAGNPFFLDILGVFAILALLLSAIGIYGLIAYSVGQRKHEIGIRMALGARSDDVLHMVLIEGLKMTAIGGAIGLAMALPLPKVFDAIFSDLKISEPHVYFIVPVAIIAVAALATYIPARRAAQVDPMAALRQD